MNLGTRTRTYLAAEALLLNLNITVDEVRDGELPNAGSIQSGSEQGPKAKGVLRFQGSSGSPRS